MERFTRREILAVLRDQGVKGYRRIVKECRSFERYQRVREIERESRQVTELGKLNRRLWNDACFMGRVGYASYGGLDVLVTAQPRAGR